MSTELAIALVLIVGQRAPAPQNPAETRRPAHASGSARCGCRSDHHSPGCSHGGTRRPPHGSLFSPGHRRFVAESVINWDFVPLPVAAGPFHPFGFGGFAPLVLWDDPIFVPAAGPLVDRAAQIAPPVAARGATIDIPERVVDDLLGRRRPTLAQRAQAARLEAAGDTMFRGGYYSRASERYQQALAQAPDHDEVKFKRGAALIAAGQYGEASRVLREALHDRPDWPFVRHDLLTLFPDEAAVERVLDNLDREARRPDADSDLVFLRAYVLYFSGRREAAEMLFRNPPGGGVPPAHFQLFQQALERMREGR